MNCFKYQIGFNLGPCNTAGMLPGSPYNRWKSSITSAADALCCLCGTDFGKAACVVRPGYSNTPTS